ncbi:MAG: SsrA-binding protein SmpB [Candidatus Andersenbacteria bacterium]
MSIYATNKRARADYQLHDTFVAGIKLSGAEVKSVKKGGMRLLGAYVTLHNGQASLVNAHIAAYKPAGPQPDYDPTRSRPLLLKRSELRTIVGQLNQKGLTLVPLRAIGVRNLIKIEFAVGRGKRQYEKRDVLRKREADRTINRALRRRR